MPLPVTALNAVFRNLHWTLGSNLCARVKPNLLGFLQALASRMDYEIRESDGLISDAKAIDLQAIDCSGYDTGGGTETCPTIALTGIATAGDAQVALTFTAAKLVAGYTHHIEWLNVDTWTALDSGTTVGSSFSYTDTSLTNGTAYQYRAWVSKAGCDDSAVCSVSATPVACDGYANTVAWEIIGATIKFTVTGAPDGAIFTMIQNPLIFPSECAGPAITLRATVASGTANVTFTNYSSALGGACAPNYIAIVESAECGRVFAEISNWNTVPTPVVSRPTSYPIYVDVTFGAGTIAYRLVDIMASGGPRMVGGAAVSPGTTQITIPHAYRTPPLLTSGLRIYAYSAVRVSQAAQV